MSQFKLTVLFLLYLHTFIMVIYCYLEDFMKLMSLYLNFNIGLIYL